MLRSNIRYQADRPFMITPNHISFSGGEVVEVANPMLWISCIDKDVYAGPHQLDGKLIVVRLPGSDAYMDTLACI